MKIGSLVSLTDEALKMLPRYRTKTGCILWLSDNGKYARIKWDHLNAVQFFAVALLDEMNRRAAK